MIARPALPCPSCKRVLEAHSWHDAGSGECRRCTTSFEFIAFPALTAGKATASAEAAVLDAESVCFFHAGNRAESVCEECGRLLCPVCTIPFVGRKLCPTCVASASRRPSTETVAVRDRVVYENIVLGLAILPLLIFYFTVITAPVALGFAIYGWNKPPSLVHGKRRWKLVVGGLIALAEIVGWVLLFVHLPSQNR